jgi:hypothetical protein
MGKETSEGLNDCINQLRAQQELICGSFTTYGFIDRVVYDFMRILRTHPSSKRRVEIWEKYLLDSGLRNAAYRELHEGYSAIYKKAASNGEEALIEVLDNLLLKVSSAGDYHREPIPPYERVFPHLRAYHMQFISREIPFAPSVARLKERDSYTQQLREADTDPKYLWGWLVLLERWWKMKDQELSINWPAIKEEGIGLWLESDRRWRVARDCRFASDFKFVDDPNYNKNKYFDRAFIERVLDRTIKELTLSCERDDPRTRDKEKADVFIENYWLRNPYAKQANVLDGLKAEIGKNSKWLEQNYEDSTLKNWIRKLDKRENRPRGAGKRHKNKTITFTHKFSQ